jgi:hypothetical protein
VGPVFCPAKGKSRRQCSGSDTDGVFIPINVIVKEGKKIKRESSRRGGVRGLKAAAEATIAPAEKTKEKQL